MSDDLDTGRRSSSPLACGSSGANRVSLSSILTTNSDSKSSVSRNGSVNRRASSFTTNARRWYHRYPWVALLLCGSFSHIYDIQPSVDWTWSWVPKLNFFLKQDWPCQVESYFGEKAVSKESGFVACVCRSVKVYRHLSIFVVVELAKRRVCTQAWKESSKLFPRHGSSMWASRCS
jgi:hypothetical protein